MASRRKFLTAVGLGAAHIGCGAWAAQPNEAAGPTVVSTWDHGLAANEGAWKVLAAGGRALDAVEAGVRVSESDPQVNSVGYGGLPDRDGRVTLDACIMDEHGDCGSVAYLRHIKNPISVARRVMEKTPHVMLVGNGAYRFAIEEGFAKQELLTDESRAAWEQWRQGQRAPRPQPGAAKPQAKRQANSPAKAKPRRRPGGRDNHDTIGMLAIDSKGNLSGACTTSGLAWKLPGRVGDSPIIGAGLYVDNEIGAATATGVGEAVIRAVGSFLVVELMRQGNTPQQACRLAVERVIAKNPDWRDLQVGFIALDKRGQVGGYSIQAGFEYAVREATGKRLVPAPSRVPGK